MPIYNAADIVGKSLVTREPVPIKRLPMDSAAVVFTAAKGQNIGVVDSWISPGANNKRLYWAFKDDGGRFYYAEMLEGRYSRSDLKDQGVLSTKEKAETEAHGNESIKDFIERNIKTIGIIAAIAVAAKSALPELIRKSKK